MCVCVCVCVCKVDIYFQLFLNIYFANLDSLSNLLIIMHFLRFVLSMYVCVGVCMYACMCVCVVCIMCVHIYIYI